MGDMEIKKTSRGGEEVGEYYKGLYIRKGNAGYDKDDVRYFVQEHHMAHGYLFFTRTMEEAKQAIDEVT